MKVDKALDATGNVIPMVLDEAGLEWGSLEFVGGKITGTHGLTLVNSSSTWTGGEFSTVTFNIPGLTIGTGTDAKKVSGGAKLNLTGATTWSADNISTGGGSELNNAAGVAFTVTGSGNITHDNTGSRATFKNDGTFTKAATSTGTTEIDAIFNNNGAVNVNAGTLKLKGGGTHATGTLTVATGATLQIADTNYAFNGGALTGGGTVEITGATTTFNGTAGGNTHLKVSGGKAKLDANFTTSGNLTVSSGAVEGATPGTTATVGNLAFDGGDIVGITINSGNATIGGSSGKYIKDGAQLNLSGNTTWGADQLGGATGIAASGATTQIKNTGNITISTNATVGAVITGNTTVGESATSANRATFRNEGTFKKTTGSEGTTTVSTIFANTGNIVIETGTLDLQGGGTSTGGNVSLSSGAKLLLQTNDYSFNGTALNGAGTLDLTGNTTTFAGTSGNATLKVAGGTAKFSGNHTGSGVVLLESGKLEVVNGAQVDLGGVTTWSGAAIATSGNATKLKNTGTFSVTTDGGKIGNDATSADRATFENTNIFHKTNTGGGGATDIEAKFDNTSAGTVKVDGGILRLKGGGASSGNFDVGGVVEIDTNNYSFASGALTGSGMVQLNSAVTSFGTTSGNTEIYVNGGTASFDGAHSGTGKLSLVSGNVSGSGTSQFAALEWSGGNLNGKVKTTTSATLIGNQTIGTSGELTVAGSFSSTGALTNQGKFIKQGSDTTTDLTTAFDNSGTGAVLQIDSGTLKLSGGGKASGSVTVANGGKLDVASNYTFDAATLSGDVDLTAASTTTTFKTANATNAKVAVKGATLDLDGASTLGTLSLASGNLTSSTGGSATVTSLEWSGGNLNGKVKATTSATLTGDQTIGSAGELTVAGSLSSSGKLTNQGKFIKQGSDTTTDLATAFDNSGTGAVLQIDSGTLKLSGGGKASGNVTVASGGKLDVASNYTFDAATLSGDVDLTAASTTTTFKTANATNAKVAVKGATLDLDGASTLGTLSLASGNLTSSTGGSATVTSLEWSGGNLNGKVKATTSATLTGDQTIGSAGELTVAGSLSSSGKLTNQGKFIKQGSDTTTDLATAFDNSGTGALLQIDSGTLKLSGGGKASGNVTVASGGKLDVASNYTFDATTLSGDVDLTAASTTTTFKTANATNAKVAVKGATLDLDGVSTLGTLSLASGNLTSSTGGSANVSTLEWSGGNLNGKVKAGSTSLSSGAKTIGAAGELTLAGALSTTGVGSLTNQGKLIKQGTGTTTDLATVFDNTGVNAILQIDSGTLKLSGGGKASGNVAVASGGKLDVASNYTFDAATLSGEIDLSAASTTTTFKTANATNAKVAVKGATLHFDGISTLGTLSLASGNVTAASGGSATVTSLEWSGGSINGKVKATSSATLTGNQTIGSAGEFTVAASLSATGTLTNQGKFIKQGAGTTTDLGAFFDSSATTSSFAVDSGTLKLSGGGKAAGTVSVGGKLQLASAYTFEGAALSGAGEVELTSATTKFKNSSSNAKVSINGGNLDFEGTATVGTLALGLGNVTTTGTNAADVASLEWSGGNLNGKIKSSGAAFNGGTKNLGSSADVVLQGTTSWDGSRIEASGAAKMKNENGAAFIANGDGVLANSGSAVFTNNGSFTKTGGNGGSTQLQARFENNGSVNVQAGKLALQGGGSSSGSILVDATASLEISNGLDLLTNSTLHGNGIGRVIGGTLSANGSIAIKNFSFEGGSLAGTNTFTGTVDWTGGNWSSAGSTTITGTLNFRGSGHDFSSRSILNQGTVNWHAGNLHGGNGSVFTNSSVFNDLSGTNKSLTNQGGATSFTNNGEYRKTGGGTTTVEGTFTNNGGLKISAGSMVFAGTFANNGSLNITNGASASFSAPLSFGTNSPLSGVGTINAPNGVSAAGQVSPGVSPGMLTINGGLTLHSTSTLLIELGGPGQGTGYDFLNITGAGLLAGSLHVTFLNGYQWSVQPTDTFTILNAGALSGAFSNTLVNGRMSSFDGAATFKVNYGLNSVTLSEFVVAVPEPSTYAMLGLGAVVVFWSIRRRRK